MIGLAVTLVVMHSTAYRALSAQYQPHGQAPAEGVAPSYSAGW